MINCILLLQALSPGCFIVHVMNDPAYVDEAYRFVMRHRSRLGMPSESALQSKRAHALPHAWNEIPQDEKGRPPRYTNICGRRRRPWGCSRRALSARSRRLREPHSTQPRFGARGAR